MRKNSGVLGVSTERACLIHSNIFLQKYNDINARIWYVKGLCEMGAAFVDTQTKTSSMSNFKGEFRAF